MSLQNRMFALSTPEEVDAFLAQYPTAAIFKAGTCHKTMQGWGNIEALLREREDVPVGVIRVVEQRPASNHVAERSGVMHQSPQIILFQNGQAKFDLDNWNITLENLEPNLAAHAPHAGGSAAGAKALQTNLQPYKNLLDQLLSGQINETQFQWSYLETLKGDASLRSQEEFAALDSLFGNPDDHHIHAGAIMQLESKMQSAGEVAPLVERAKELRLHLDSL